MKRTSLLLIALAVDRAPVVANDFRYDGPSMSVWPRTRLYEPMRHQGSMAKCRRLFASNRT